MAILILLVVLFFKPILRAVGLINEAMNEGLDKVQEKIKKEGIINDALNAGLDRAESKMKKTEER